MKTRISAVRARQILDGVDDPRRDAPGGLRDRGQNVFTFSA